jgi:hypothetical protein
MEEPCLIRQLPVHSQVVDEHRSNGLVSQINFVDMAHRRARLKVSLDLRADEGVVLSDLFVSAMPTAQNA